MTDQAPYLKPGIFLVKFVNPILVKFGLVPVITIKGRKSGKLIKTPITPIEYNGEQFLVSARGLTQWVRNLRAEKKGMLTRNGRTVNFSAVEVSGKMQQEVIADYRSKVKIANTQFTALPDSKDHPVFRIDVRK